MDNNILGLNEFLQPVNAPISNKQKQTQAVTFEKENILPTGYVNYTNLNQSTRPYTAVLSLSREAGTFDDIQEAINYVNRQGGGTIFVKKGRYELPNDITMYSNIFFVGEDSLNCVFSAAGFNFGFICTSLTNFGFRNLAFTLKTGSTGFINCSGTLLMTIDSCVFQLNTTDISLTNVTNAVISNCYSDTSSTFSSLVDCHGCTYQNNTISQVNIGFSCTSSSQTLFTGNQLSYFVAGFTGAFSGSDIIGNYITTYNPGGSVAGYAISLDNVTTVQVANNNILVTSGKGLYCGTVVKSQFTGNNIACLYSHAMTMITCDSCQVSGNRLTAYNGAAASFDGLRLSSNSDKNAIAGNYIEYSGTSTAYSLNIGAGCDYNGVAGNTLAGGTIDSGANNQWAGNAN